MRPAAFVIAALFLPIVPPVAAQEPPPVQVGERVRVWTSLSRVGTLGTLASWHADSLAVSSSGEETWIPLTSITRLDVGRRKSAVALSAAIGAGGVAALTLVVLAVADVLECTDIEFGRRCQESFFERDLGNGVTVLGAIGIGAGVGLVGGALVGATIKTYRWVSVPLDRLRVSFGPQRDGRFGLGLSVRF